MSRSSSASALAGSVLVGAFAGCVALFPYNPENLFETAVRADCAFAFRCCTGAERSVTSKGNFRDEDSCIKETLETGGEAANIGLRAREVVAAGHGEFDSVLADECTKAGTDARYACDAEAVLTPGPRDAECIAGAARAFVVGNVDDGDDCTDDIECADEGSCVREPSETELTIAGKCRARADEGDECGERVCKTGFVCLPNEADELRCAEPTLKENDDACSDSGECASGFCTTVTTLVCAISGDPCATDADCTNFADFCTTASSSTCTARGPKVEICDGLGE